MRLWKGSLVKKLRSFEWLLYAGDLNRSETVNIRF